MASDILFERRNHVAWITLNRPAARNAITRGMCADLVEVIAELRDDRSTRAIVLKGQGGDFTVGADLKEMAGLTSLAADQRGVEMAEMAREIAWPIFLGMHELRQPIVASVRGHVIGVGVQFVLAADLSIASETARLLLPMARLGHSVDHGESYYLPKKVGLARAMQLLMLAETWTGREAEGYGLVNWTVPDDRLDQKTDEIVERVASGAPAAVQQMKSLLRESLHRTIREQLSAEAESLAICATTADFGEALTAFTEKRNPVFRGT